MKKSILFILLISMPLLIFSQEMFKAKNTSKTSFGAETSTSKMSKGNTMTSRSGSGTVNGSIVADLSVTATGGVNYTVPINVPPGLNGVQPDIALTFDSQSGNGMAGWGWNVSGVSVITRIPSTQFHDNFIDPLDFDLDDRFALDGQRLIVKTGSYGSDGTVYQTEQYSNAKIVSYGTHPTAGVDGPRYFKVFYPDGSIGHYGETDDSRSHTDYAISYWENPQGIRIDYTYTTNLNSLSIDKITYGSTVLSGHVNEIKFDYETRERAEHTFINGVDFRRSQRLFRIVVRGNQNIHRSYDLSFDSDTSLGYDRLTSIGEGASFGSSGRTITLQYGDTNFQGVINNGEAAQLSLSNIEQRNAKVVPLDYTGNGKMDFIVYPTTGPDAKKKIWLFDDIQGNINYSTGIDTGFFREVFPVNWLNHEDKLMQQQGLVTVKETGSNQVDFTIRAKGAPSAGTFPTIYSKNWDAPTYKPENYCGNNNSNLLRVPLQYLSGDFNGDGLSDVLAIEKKYITTDCIEVPSTNDPNCPNKVTRNGIEYCCYGCTTSTKSTSKVHLVQLDRRKVSNFASDIGFLGRELKSTDQTYTLDVNGDGKTDILQVTDGHVYVYGLDKNNNIVLLWDTADSIIDLEFQIMPGDYNGDGKSDFMIPTANNSQTFAIFISTGGSFVKKTPQLPFEYKHTDYNSQGTGTLYGYNLLPVDINGDSKTDIISYNTVTTTNSSIGTQHISVYQNIGGNPLISSVPFDFEQVGSNITHVGQLKHYPIPIFLSSDEPNGNLDFASISDKWVSSFSFSKDHREDVTLEQVNNNGLVTDINYDRVNTDYDGDGDPNFFKAYSAPGAVYTQSYPFVNINNAPSFKVVRELEQSGSGLTRFRRFYYEGAVSHAHGLGFMGFEILKRSNWYGDNVPALWTISEHDPLLRGAPTEQTVSDSYATDPSSYMSKVNYFYDYTLIANPGSPSAPQYPDFLTRNYTISGQQTDEAEEYISFLPGFYANGTNGTYSADVIPPEEQPGAAGYAGAVDIRLNRMETDNGLTGVLTTETYVYDQYNNRIMINTVFPGGSRVVNYTYSNNPTATGNTYHVGKQESMKETMTMYGNSFSTEEQYEYNNNLVVKIKRKGNGTPWVTQELQYDSYGNVTSKILKGDNVVDRIQDYEYGSQYGHRFLTKATDIEGLETTFAYDTTNGNLTSTTDAYGLTTSYLHDGWDRISKETDYLSNEINRSYTSLSGGELKYTVDYPDGGKEETYYNAFGWTTRFGTLSLNNDWSYTDYDYDVSGRLKGESEPHNGSPSQWNTTVYDVYGRPITQQLYTGRNITISYTGLSSTVNDGVKNTTSTLDALGNVVKSQDPGGTIDYTYHASGQLKTADYDSHQVTVGVDGWGRKTSLNDPSAGTYTYDYNGFGELVEQAGPKGTTTYQYDNFGKVTNKTVVGDLTDLSLTYTYDNLTKQLTDIVGQDNTNSGRAYTYEYEYDMYQRPESIKENTGLASFEYGITYDSYGRVDKETQIANLTGGASKSLTTRNVYDTSGLLKEIWNDGTPDKLWELNQINPRGQSLSITLGNGLTKTNTYDGYGYLTKIEDKETGTNPTVALHTEYDFNAQRGTLNSRENFGFNWQETFGYDNLDRLTTISGDVTKTMTFDSKGRISNNTAIGAYAYDSSSKYRLNEIDPNNTGETYFQQHPTQQITYNAFKKPVEIHEAGHGRVSFEYGPLMNRSTAYYGGEQVDRALRRYRKHYSSIIPAEIIEDTQAGSTKIITYVAGDAYSAPIAHIKQTGTNALDEYHYLHRDYLGSILAITDADGDVVEERQFGAWGTVDKFLDNNGGTTFGHTSLMGRGYTGHEHFFEVSLIHMNGRMYDANLGRFLSPDNYIQDPFNTQNYNRYAYVLNNPLLYTDPSGEYCVECGAAVTAIIYAIFISAAVVGAYALISSFADNGGGSATQNVAPSPSNVTNNSQMASSMSRQSRGNGSLNDGGGIALNIPAVESAINGSNVATVFDNMSFQSSGAYGVSQTGSADPLQGIAVPDNFVPNDGLDDQGFNITTEDVLDTFVDFLPFASGGKDIYQGVRDGNGWMVALGVGSIILDVVTLGGSSIAKGAIKTGIKAGGRVLTKKAVQGTAKTTRKFWTKSTYFKNTKVFQRDDLINPNLIDARGRSNLQRMQKGLAPIGSDGKSLNLHHIGQGNNSSIAEMLQTFHKGNHKVIHINPNTVPSGIDRSAFNSWRTSYWKNRAKDF